MGSEPGPVLCRSDLAGLELACDLCLPFTQKASSLLGKIEAPHGAIMRR